MYLDLIPSPYLISLTAYLFAIFQFPVSKTDVPDTDSAKAPGVHDVLLAGNMTKKSRGGFEFVTATSLIWEQMHTFELCSVVPRAHLLECV
jgi:hypothetical protein